MLVAAAVCPHPPLLVPEAMGLAGWPQTQAQLVAAPAARPEAERMAVAAGFEAQVDAQIRLLRAACCAAVRGLAAAQPDLIVVIGGGSVTATYPGTAAGGLGDLGVPFTAGSGEPVLPLSLTVGSWLIRHFLDRGTEPPPLAGRGLDQQVRECRIELQEVARSWSAAECGALGARLAVAAPRVALLVMGDGSARKALGVREAADPAAERYDTQAASALAAGDVAALAALDQAIAEECLVTGWTGWQVLAGAAAGRRIRGQLSYAAAPLAVSYFVALWLPD